MDHPTRDRTWAIDCRDGLQDVAEDEIALAVREHLCPPMFGSTQELEQGDLRRIPCECALHTLPRADDVSRRVRKEPVELLLVSKALSALPHDSNGLPYERLVFDGVRLVVDADHRTHQQVREHDCRLGVRGRIIEYAVHVDCTPRFREERRECTRIRISVSIEARV